MSSQKEVISNRLPSSLIVPFVCNGVILLQNTHKKAKNKVKMIVTDSIISIKTSIDIDISLS